MTVRVNDPARYVVALDLDGTLLRDDKTVSDFTVETLERVSAAGVNFFFTTGRRQRIAVPVLERFDFPSWLIMNNGTVALSRHGGDRLFTHYMPEQMVRDAIRCLADFERPPVLLIDPDGAPHDIVMSPLHLDVPVYREYAAAHEGYVIVADVLEEHPAVSRVVGMFMSEPRWRISDYKSHLTRVLGDTIEHRSLDNLVYAPSHRILELVEPGWTKWRGITELKNLVTPDAECIIAFGDDHNDIDMLTHADMSFAVANAVDAAREAADEDSPSNEEDGVARTLREVFAEVLVR